MGFRYRWGEGSLGCLSCCSPLPNTGVGRRKRHQLGPLPWHLCSKPPARVELERSALLAHWGCPGHVSLYREAPPLLLQTPPGKLFGENKCTSWCGIQRLSWLLVKRLWFYSTPAFCRWGNRATRQPWTQGSFPTWHKDWHKVLFAHKAISCLNHPRSMFKFYYKSSQLDGLSCFGLFRIMSQNFRYLSSSGWLD